MKNVERVKWNDQDIKSIEQAERKKARLENAGYSLIQSIPGLLRGELVYRREA